jgi:hypothetical protein
MWKDMRLAFSYPFMQFPIGLSCMLCNKVPKKNWAIKEKIPTLPMLLEYTTFIRGVDVADYL